MNTFPFALPFTLPFAAPLTAAPDLIRKNAESQLSLLMAISGKLVNASLQLGELNRTASQKLMEESMADAQRALQVRTLADAQSFLSDQTQMSVQRVQGYMQNLQNIAAENLIGVQQQVEAASDAGRNPARSTTEDEDTKEHASSAPHKHPHEVDVQPSPLMEKLVASVAVDPTKAGARPH